MTQVLIVEDEPEIRRFVRVALEGEGCHVHEAATLKDARLQAGTRKPDLLIVDLGLPDGDGIDLIRDVRAWSQVPVIVLSARDAESQKIAALDAGADDYLTKPFGLGELMARVRVALRRAAIGKNESPLVRFGDVEVDLGAHTVLRGGAAVHLTALEFRLLAMLIANAGRVLTHRQIVREVWGPAYADQTHYARVYMQHLRQKLERDPSRPAHLLTETGVGYRFTPQ
jgi:two-component system KDP operon response regulator KdpE